jgi:hypothetical protein
MHVVMKFKDGYYNDFKGEIVKDIQEATVYLVMVQQYKDTGIETIADSKVIFVPRIRRDLADRARLVPIAVGEVESKLADSLGVRNGNDKS